MDNKTQQMKNILDRYSENGKVNNSLEMAIRTEIAKRSDEDIKKTLHNEEGFSYIDVNTYPNEEKKQKRSSNDKRKLQLKLKGSLLVAAGLMSAMVVVKTPIGGTLKEVASSTITLAEDELNEFIQNIKKEQQINENNYSIEEEVKYFTGQTVEEITNKGKGL